MIQQPFYKTFGLKKPAFSGGRPRVKIMLSNGVDGWHDIDYQEFLDRAVRKGWAREAASSRLCDGYEVNVRGGVCVLAAMVDELQAKKAAKLARKAHVAHTRKEECEPSNQMTLYI